MNNKFWNRFRVQEKRTEFVETVKSVRGTNVDWHYEWPWFRTIGAFPNSSKKYIGFNSHFSSWSVPRNTSHRQLSDHDVISGTLKVYIPPKKKSQKKVYLYQKGDFESMRKDASDLAKDRYFNGYSDNRSVQETFDLISFIQESADNPL